MEQHIKKQKEEKSTKTIAAPNCGPDLTFEKLAYVVPTSMNLPLMSDRSILRKTEKLDASVKDKKGKKDKKDKDKEKDKETSGSRTPVTNMSNAGGAPVRASKDKVTVSSKRASEVGDYGGGYRRDPNRAEVPSPLLRNMQATLGDPVSED